MYPLPENITVPVGIACNSKPIVFWPEVTAKSLCTLLFMPLATNRTQLTLDDGTLKTASMRASPCNSTSLAQARMAAKQTAWTTRIM